MNNNNCWEISLKIMSLMGDIDALVEKKSRCKNVDEDNLLDQQITIKEVEMFTLKNLLKNTTCN